MTFPYAKRGPSLSKRDNHTHSHIHQVQLMHDLLGRPLIIDGNNGVPPRLLRTFFTKPFSFKTTTWVFWRQHCSGTRADQSIGDQPHTPIGLFSDWDEYEDIFHPRNARTNTDLQTQNIIGCLMWPSCRNARSQSDTSFSFIEFINQISIYLVALLFLFSYVAFYCLVTLLLRANRLSGHEGQKEGSGLGTN